MFGLDFANHPWKASGILCLWLLLAGIVIFALSRVEFFRKLFFALKELLLWWVLLPFGVYWLVLIICTIAHFNLYEYLDDRGITPPSWFFVDGPNDIRARKGLAILCAGFTFLISFLRGLHQANEKSS